MNDYVKKGWGYEIIIVNKPEYCGKLLHFEKGKRCSWHYHELKDETFYLQSGKLVVYHSDADYSSPYSSPKGADDMVRADSFLMCPGMKFHVPRGMRHQMVALEESDLFEFSTQDFFHDSYRVQVGD